MKNNFFLAVLTGMLLSFSWPETGFFIFIFIAFVPLLLLEYNISNNKGKNYWKVFGYSLLSFFIFNVITTYWVWHATILGSFAAFLINALLMSVTFVLFHILKKYLGNKKGYFSLVFLWISMEYLHLHWQLAWPWLTLGNVFAPYPVLVQWYEYTGVLGGSLWVLVLNILIFRCWIFITEVRLLILPSLLFLFPLLLSIYIGFNINILEYSKKETVIVQPNVDPYLDKFNRDSQSQLNDFISLAKSQLTQNTDLLIGPETCLQEPIWENKITKSKSIEILRKLQDEFPNLNILIGSSTFKYLGNNKEENSRSLNRIEWYNAYNSAIFLSSDSTISVYHKTKLVPGVEQIPYSFIFNLITDLTVDLGGVSGSLSLDNDIKNFKIDDINILPLICYESIFGDMLTLSNSNLLAVITNDGWWKNTAGYKQHFQYARLRSIEQRRSLIRSANTGISSVILPNGNILKSTNWNEEIAINVMVPLNDTVTFYNRFGDYIGRIFSFISVLLLLTTFVRGMKR